MMNRTAAVTALLSTAVLAVAGCGGGDDKDSEADRQAKVQEAALKHAKCMRENGVNVPDPKFDGGRVTMGAGGPGKENVDPEAFERAEQKCEHFFDDLPAPEISEEQSKEIAEKALAHARCMREHGINFPDPRIDGGRIQQRIEGGVNPEDPKFQEAQKACGGDFMKGKPAP